MKQLVLKYLERFESLSERERVSLFIAGLLVCVYLIFAIAIEPAQRRARALRSQIAEQQADIASMQARARLPQSKLDPDATNRARGDDLRRQIESLDQTLKAMQRELVTADRMTSLLREMLASDTGLRLVGLRTLPAAPLISRGEQNPNAPAPAEAPKSGLITSNVYKHGLEITVRGGYSNLHAYLQRLERSPWRMYWWRARLVAHDDGRPTLVITIYTLSLERAWLQV